MTKRKPRVLYVPQVSDGYLIWTEASTTHAIAKSWGRSKVVKFIEVLPTPRKARKGKKK